MKAKMILRQAKHGAVLDDGPIVLAETSVKSLTDRAFGYVPRHHAIDQPKRVFASDVVLVKRRDIDQSRRIADGVILVIVHHIVRARDKVA